MWSQVQEFRFHTMQKIYISAQKIKSVSDSNKLVGAGNPEDLPCSILDQGCRCRLGLGPDHGGGQGVVDHLGGGGDHSADNL